MPTNFPTSIDTTTNLPTSIADATTQATNHPAYHNTEDGALLAIEAKLGIGASTPTNGLVLVGGVTPGTSAWTAGGGLPAGTAGAGLAYNATAFVASGLRFSAVAYGVVGDNNNATAGANTTALNACIAAAAAAGPGAMVEFDWLGTAYVNGAHLIYSRLIYTGRLFGGTLKLANGRPAGTNVMQTASFATLTQTKGIAGAGEYEFFLDRLSIDGNKANNATGGRGIAIYGYGYWTGDLTIVNCKAAGFWSEYWDTGEPINTGVGSTHQRGAHLGGKLTLINNDCATTAAVNTRLTDGKAAFGGAQFTFFGPGDSEANTMEIFRDSAVTGSGFQLTGIDFTSGTGSAFGFNIKKLIVWLNHDIGVQVDAGIFFCDFLHSEGANINVQLSAQEWHISQSEIFGPRTSGTNLSITGGGNHGYIQSSMESCSSGGTMVNIASNTCKHATLLLSCADGGAYNYTLAAGSRPFAARECSVSLSNFGSGVVTAGWVPACPNFPGDTYPGTHNRLQFFSSAVTVQGGSTIHSTSGVPNAAMGANGDICIRTDTPGTVNQRIYVRASGAWTGIL